MLRIGITGQSGFVGTHLSNTLLLQNGKYEVIDFKDEYFNSSEVLANFVTKCDVIVHLAAVNRHSDPNILYDTNIELTEKLIHALRLTAAKPHILFSSSIQEELDNHYGRSKADSRKLLESWAEDNSARFTGLVIPNVYGPFCKPNYNSVVATFCHQLTHDETPRILHDSSLGLIYVGELIDNIIGHISTIHDHPEQSEIGSRVINHIIESSKTIDVSDLLVILKNFKEGYFQYGLIPDLSDSFTKNLFDTFLCYINHETFFPRRYNLHSDERGSFVEIAKTSSQGQISFSTTKPGVVRGNHYHTRKTERFAVVKGKAKIELRRIGKPEKFEYFLDGDNPSFVDMPIWYTHNIANIGKGDLIIIFWTNEHFNSNDPDTYSEDV